MVASERPGRSPASRPGRNHGRGGKSRTSLRADASARQARTGRNQRQLRPSAFGFQFSLQIVALPKVEPAEDAFADFDFKFAEVGDGLEFPEHSRRFGQGRRHCGVTDRLVRQPFPKPAGFERIGVKFSDVNGVLTLALGAIVVVRPKNNWFNGSSESTQ